MPKWAGLWCHGQGAFQLHFWEFKNMTGNFRMKSLALAHSFLN